MKKNAMLKIAAVLLVAVLLTTCAISSTFAKYTATGGQKTASAKVAKWGVTVTSSLEGLFATSYDIEDTNYVGEDDDKAVLSADAKMILAPGTSGSATSASVITGTPEVAVRVATTATVTMTGDWIDDEEKFYCPVTFTITTANGVKTFDSTNCTDTADMASKMKTEIEAASKDFPAGTVLDDESIDVAISWVWNFTGDDDADTALGNAAAGVGGKTLPEISIAFTQTVTQID